MSKPLHLNNDELKSIACLKKFATESEKLYLARLLSGSPVNLCSSTFDPLQRYCPHSPWAKQNVFLGLTCREAFYGGAAAGGKSEALLMAALQYVHTPGYSALILRKDTQRLKLSGGLIPRSQQWLAGTGAKWNAGDLRWTFPTGGAPASISFGYLFDSRDRYRYGSSEYQYIAFDELTEFPEEDYLFLFSRLRRTHDLEVPLRMRSASNPGNLGHHWVKNRFISDEALVAAGTAGSPETSYKNDAAYVPARIHDNPAVDGDEYRQNLMHLPAVTRERLMNGDWSISEQGLIRQEWLRYFTLTGQRLELLDDRGEKVASINEEDCYRFATVDPAGTSADRAAERRGKPPSWSVVQVWDRPGGATDKFLILRHVYRQRVDFVGLCNLLRETHRQWRPARLLIENEKLGQAAYDTLHDEMPIETIPTGGRDKAARAAPLLVK